MSTEEFTQLTLEPNTVSKEQIISLESVLDEYPYFQAAHVIHLKGLKNQRNFKYNNTLKKVAAYTTNRTILFDFITANVLDYQTISKSEENILNEIEVIDSKVIEHLYESITASQEPEIDVDTTKSATNFEERLRVEEEKLEIGQPIDFSKNDLFSFNEWLQLKTKQPIKRIKNEVEKEKSSTNAKKKEDIKISKKLDLIEQFIINKPKIKPVETKHNIDIAAESIVENTNLMTETLARVYLEQKKYNKAIAAFKILSLKYPKKSSFFADRIKAIKFLQKHKS